MMLVWHFIRNTYGQLSIRFEARGHDACAYITRVYSRASLYSKQVPDPRAQCCFYEYADFVHG